MGSGGSTPLQYYYNDGHYGSLNAANVFFGAERFIFLWKKKRKEKIPDLVAWTPSTGIMFQCYYKKSIAMSCFYYGHSEMVRREKEKAKATGSYPMAKALSSEVLLV